MLGLYVHIPFCAKKCNYCDFCSYDFSKSDVSVYTDKLCEELSLYKPEKIDTIYFGGGTPSVVPTDEVYRVMNAIDKKFYISKDSEITIEANPGTITVEKAKCYKKMGFNRVSLGAQSFLNSELKILGRIHSASDTLTSYDILRKSGFENISLDLMYAIPEQTKHTLSTSLNEVLNLCPEHISCYGLKIEDGTPFFDMAESGMITEQSDETYAEMYEIICEKTADFGYEQYELSNFSKPGFESRHNLKYWLGKEYIGIGVSAASYYSSKRYTRFPNMNSYLKNFENSECITLSDFDRMSEFMFLSLRLTKIGAQKDEFFKRFNRTVDSVFHTPLSKHIKSGMIIELDDRYVLSPKAYYISNSVLCDFV